MGEAGKEGSEFKRTETELERLIREVKQSEKEEEEEKRVAALSTRRDHHITSHFDLSTLKLTSAS